MIGRLRFICDSLMTSAFNNVKFNILFPLETSFKSNMLQSYPPLFLHTIWLKPNSLQIFNRIWERNNIIPITRKKVYFKTINTNQWLNLLNATHLLYLIKSIDCRITHIKFTNLGVKRFVIYGKVIINWLVIETLCELCPSPWPIIIHLKILNSTESFGRSFHKTCLWVMGFSVIAWPINIIGIDSFQ